MDVSEILLKSTQKKCKKKALKKNKRVEGNEIVFQSWNSWLLIKHIHPRDYSTNYNFKQVISNL